MRTDEDLDGALPIELKGLAPFYLYGHKLEVANRLAIKNNDAVYKEQKYPLVALFMDYPERFVEGMVNYTLHIVIMNLTDRNYLMEERDEKIFKPILYPLFDSFMIRLRRVGKFVWPGDMQYPPMNKVDRPYSGIVYEQGNLKYIFNDRLDAIEISDLKISRTINKC